MADHDDALAAPLDGRPHALGRRARRQPLVGLGRRAGRLRDLGARLSRAKERARQDDVGPDSVGCELLAEGARLLAADGRQRAQLVGLELRGLGVAHEVQAHAGRIRI